MSLKESSMWSSLVGVMKQLELLAMEKPQPYHLPSPNVESEHVLFVTASNPRHEE